MDRTKRKELEDKLFEILPAINDNREIKDSIRQYYINKNINSAVPMRIINKSVRLEIINDVHLCIFINAINTYPNNFGLKTTDYFTKTDIDLAEGYKKEKLEKNNTFLFHDVSISKLRNGIYISNEFTFDELEEMVNDSKLGYNFDIQREGTKIMKKGKVVTIPTVSKKSIRDIQNKWEDGKFFPNMITFSVENPLKVIYDPNERILEITLNDKDVFFCADGWHRSRAALDVKRNNPKFKLGYYYLRLLIGFSNEQIKELIHQEDQHTPINKEHINMMNMDDTSTRVIKNIEKYGTKITNPMYFKFGEKVEDITKFNKYCFYSDVTFPIKEYLDVNNIKETNIVKDIQDNLLLRGLGYIVGLNKNEFNNKEKSQKTNIITMNRTFSFYIAILSKLYKMGYHKQIELADARKLENAIDTMFKKIDFSLNNPKWRELNIVDENNKMIVKKINLTDSKRMMDYVEEIFEESELN